MEETFPGTRDILGQLPRLKGYTHLALCFAHPEGLSRGDTVAALEKATCKITAALPWLGGAVVHRGEDAGNSGNFLVARCPDTETILKIQDRSDVLSAYEDISLLKVPGDVLDVTLLSAETSLPDSYPESETNPAPVLTLTGSWIRDGLILDCAAQHNMLDMNGIDQFLRLLANTLLGQELDEAIIAANMYDRMGLFSFSDTSVSQHDISHLRCSSSLGKPMRPPAPPGWLPFFYIFRFKSTQLGLLRKTAGTPSIDDALSAFVWKRLSAIRMGMGERPDAVTGFSRAVDCRRPLNIPPEYMGNLAVKTYTTMASDELNRSSLADVVAQLRRDLREIRDPGLLRRLLAAIAEEPDKSTFSFVKGYKPDTWVNASSWAGVHAYSLKFGVLGKPSVIRRPTSKPVQSLLYFFPRTEEGDIDVQLCLVDREIQGLRADPEWRQYAEYVG
ncbi:trichothecene 3-O-acetyltransferase [Seiridium cupressi]